MSQPATLQGLVISFLIAWPTEALYRITLFPRWLVHSDAIRLRALPMRELLPATLLLHRVLKGSSKNRSVAQGLECPLRLRLLSFTRANPAVHLARLRTT